MPIFEYRCQPCGKDFELLIRAGSKPRCPDCLGEDLVKKLSAFAAPVSRTAQIPSPCGGCDDPERNSACPFR